MLLLAANLVRRRKLVILSAASAAFWIGAPCAPAATESKNLSWLSRMRVDRAVKIEGKRSETERDQWDYRHRFVWK